MKNTIAITMALIAVLLSLGTIFFQLKYKPLGDGIEKYSFAEPLEAYKSTLQMDVNQDIIAQIQLSTIITGKKNKEKLQTIKVNKTREHGGKTIMFIEYNDAGLPKHAIISMEKDAGSGFWHNNYISAYKVEETNPALAAEMKDWDKTI